LTCWQNCNRINFVQRFDGSVAKIMTDSPTDSNGRITAGLVDRSRLPGPEVVGIGTATNDVGVINSRKEGVWRSRFHCRFKSA